MIMKKTYGRPEIEIFEVEAEGTILQVSSLGMGGDDNRTDGGFEELSNKRQPASSPWDSSNWSTKE